MSRWHPQPVCGGPSCILFCDDLTGEPTHFETMCAMHRALSDAGMSDADLWTQIQIDSKHYAAALTTMRAMFPAANASVQFKADRTLEIVSDKGFDLVAMKVAIAAAIAKDQIITQLKGRGGKGTPLSVVSNG